MSLFLLLYVCYAVLQSIIFIRHFIKPAEESVYFSHYLFFVFFAPVLSLSIIGMWIYDILIQTK